MDDIDESLNSLIDKVKQSVEYRTYQEIRTTVHGDPEKEKMINEFRRCNYLLQKSKDDIDLFDEMERLEQEFAAFRAEPLVEEYLSAELAFCRLVQHINWELMNKLEFDLGFFLE